MTYKFQFKFQEFRAASVNNVTAGRKAEQEMDLSDVDDVEVDDESALKYLQESKKRKLDSSASQVSLKLKHIKIDFVKTT
jgi:hypothetical protein